MARGSIGFWVNRQPTLEYGYGLLYNWYVTQGIAAPPPGGGLPENQPIYSVGWHIPSLAEFQTLSTYLGGDAIAGGKLKETGLAHWDSPNEGATNEAKFNGVGGGGQFTKGFFDLKVYGILWSTTQSEIEPPEPYAITLDYETSIIYYGSGAYVSGLSIRLIKDSTTLTHGQSGIYTGNDGNVYPTICIGTQEWLAINLKETKYQNGDTIPEVTNNVAWAALTTGALCAYDNDWSNV